MFCLLTDCKIEIQIAGTLTKYDLEGACRFVYLLASGKLPKTLEPLAGKDLNLTSANLNGIPESTLRSFIGGAKLGVKRSYNPYCFWIALLAVA